MNRLVRRVLLSVLGIAVTLAWWSMRGNDAQGPMGYFIHWLVYNIPPTVSELPQGGPLPQGAQGVANDFGKKHYGGPCPPSGTHRYFFTIHALKVSATWERWARRTF